MPPLPTTVSIYLWLSRALQDKTMTLTCARLWLDNQLLQKLAQSSQAAKRSSSKVKALVA